MGPAGRQGMSPTCGRTDAEEPRGSHPGLRSSFFRFPFPHVHAAESPSTQTNIISLPQHIDKPEFPDTGWDRLKDVFYRREGQMYSEELRSIVKSGIAAAFVGMIYGGLPGARQARERFIKVSQAEIYQNRVDAVNTKEDILKKVGNRTAPDPIHCYCMDTKPMQVNGCRLTTFFKISSFVFCGRKSNSTVSTGLMVYRDQNALSHFAAAGAVTGGIFRMNLGLRGLVSGTIIGAGLGVPAGLFIIGLQKLGGETLCDKRRRERRELHELRVAEWAARLNLTDDFIGEMSGQNQQTETDLKRIDELLSQPRNERSKGC